MERKHRSSGFASMDQTKQREIARKGGMAAHRKGTAHEFTAEEARNAGRKGGQQVSANRSHMIEIGRLGGKRSAERRRNKSAAAGHQANEAIPASTTSQDSKNFSEDELQESVQSSQVEETSPVATHGDDAASNDSHAVSV